MSEDSVVRGRRVSPMKKERAKELRRQMTPAEAALWSELRTGRLNGLHFRRQQVIDGFIVDFYCHAARLVIEVDGGMHTAQREYDAARDEWLRARQFAVLRITNDEVIGNLPGVLARIESACNTRSEAQ